MVNAVFAEKKLKESGSKVSLTQSYRFVCSYIYARLYTLILFCVLGFGIYPSTFAQDIKEPNAAGTFYPADPQELSSTIDGYFKDADAEIFGGNIFALISPHAGYEFSGKVAAFGYKQIKNIPYKTVIIIGPSHYYGFDGVSIYPSGKFRTPLGDVEIDNGLTGKLLDLDSNINFLPEAFAKEHSIEVQIPFLQKVLSNFKIVPIVMGDCNLSLCQKLADGLKTITAGRSDILIVISTDMYHGYDYSQADKIDDLTIDYLKKMDAEGLYLGLRDNKLQLCGGFPAVVALILAGDLGYNKINILKHTNSAETTGKKIKGLWTVGYLSAFIEQHSNISKCSVSTTAEGDSGMLNKKQKQELLKLARNSIRTYLETKEKIPVKTVDPVLNTKMGAFVTLHENGQLRGCIGNLAGTQSLYLNIRDMAIEAAIGDPRFTSLTPEEIEHVEIEISALSPMQRAASADEIILGIHGVLVKRGFRTGVFLPQVAAETGWSKEEFLSYLCSQKAGLPKDAWKDKDTELYVFTAEVFSEKELASDK